MNTVTAPKTSSSASSQQPTRARNILGSGSVGFAFLLVTAACLGVRQARAAADTGFAATAMATSVAADETNSNAIPSAKLKTQEPDGAVGAPSVVAASAKVAPALSVAVAETPGTPVPKKEPVVSRQRVGQVALLAGAVLVLVNNPVYLLGVLAVGFYIR